MSSSKRILLMLALIAMWSPSFLFIKLALLDLPPMTIAASRITLAFCILFCILCIKGYSLPKTLKFWTHATVMGIFSTALPFCLFCYAEQTIDSSLAAILNGTVPMFTALLAHLFIPQDRLNFPKAIGISLCAIGLVSLFAPNLLQGVTGTTLGMLAAGTAAFSYAVQHIYGKKYFTGHKPFIAPTAALLTANLLLWPFAFAFENPLQLNVPSMTAVLGVCGLAVFGTACAFVIYYKLLEQSGPTAISLVACVFPVGGMLLGMFFLGETFTFGNMLSAGLILLGMGIVNQIVPLPFLTAQKPAVEKKQES